MTWEEAGLISADPVVNRLLLHLAQAAVSTPKLQAIKAILEGNACDTSAQYQAYSKSRNTILGRDDLQDAFPEEQLDI